MSRRNDQYMILQNHAWIHDPVKVQDRPVDHDRTEDEKVYFSISVSLASKKLSLDKFECHIKEKYLQLCEKTLNIPPFQIRIWMRPNFLHIVYPTNRL